MDDDDFLLAQPSRLEIFNENYGRCTISWKCETTRSGIQPLLPDDFGDEALAGIKFGEEFGNRYGELKLDLESNWSQRTEMLIQAKFPGHPHPQFFPGSLEDALGEACNKYAICQVWYFAWLA